MQGDKEQDDCGLGSPLSDMPRQRVLMTPNTRLLVAMAEAEAFACDPQHMVGCKGLHAENLRECMLRT
jgi:hypothetical protein